MTYQDLVPEYLPARWAAPADAAGGPGAAVRRRRFEQRQAASPPAERVLRALAPEATAAALHALLYDFVRADGPERLSELAPTATYLTLAPFLGAPDAYAAAVA
jgi:hypothetical protein